MSNHEKNEDTRQDAWERFERAVDAAVKSGPKRRAAAPMPETEAFVPLRSGLIPVALTRESGARKKRQ